MSEQRMMKMRIPVLLVMGILSSSCIYAASASLNATVTLQDVLTITASSPINFGAVSAPGIGSGQNQVTVFPTGVRSISGFGDSVLNGGTVSAGSVTVSGGAATTVNLTSSTGGVCGGSGGGLSLDSIIFDSTTLSIPGVGFASSNHGVTLPIFNGAVSGSYTCSYTINVNC